jgi:hypothetical protein
MKQNRDDQRERPREPHLVSFAALIALCALGTVINVVGNSEAFRPKLSDRTLTAALPIPPLPPVGEPLPRTTPERHVVEVQSPPPGRFGPQDTSGWLIGTPEQVYPRLPRNDGLRFHRPAVDFPQSGSVGFYSVSATIPLADVIFEDRTGDPRRKVLRIQSMDGIPAADVYMNGTGARLRLPIGQYSLSLAVGKRWEGASTLFGPYGSYFDLGDMRLETPADQGIYTRVIGMSREPATIAGASR